MGDLQQKRAPQPLPRAGIDPVTEPIPQLPERRLHPLSHGAKHLLRLTPPRGIPRPDHPGPGLLAEQIEHLLAPVARIGDHRGGAARAPHQSQGRRAVVPVPRRHDRRDHRPAGVRDQMQLEAKEPTRARLSEVGSFIAQQADAPVADRLAHRDRLGIDEVQAHRAERDEHQRGLHQMPDEGAHLMQAAQPLAVARQLREGSGQVTVGLAVGLFERWHAKRGLQKADGDHLGIGEGRVVVVARSPVGEPGVRFEEVVHEAVQAGGLVEDRGIEYIGVHRVGAFERVRDEVWRLHLTHVAHEGQPVLFSTRN